MISEGSIENAVRDLEYFRNELIRLDEAEELTENELIDLKGFINTIITHITNGNQNEERLVNIMGGTVIETESERLISQGKAYLLIVLGQEEGLDDATLLKRMQERIGLSLEQASAYLKRYGKQTV